MIKRLLAALLAFCLVLGGAALAEAKATPTPTATPAPTPLPDNIRRVVDLSGNGDVLRIMGFSVVGTTNTRPDDYTRVPSWLQGVLSGAQVLGSPYQTSYDMDAIRALAPDLIIMMPHHADIADALRKIAPTVTAKLAMRSWKMDMLTLGERLGRRDKVSAWLDTYADKALNVGKSIRETRGEDTTYLALMISDNQIYAFVDGGLGSLLYNDLGLKRPKGMSDRRGINMTTVGFDQLELLGLDHIIILGSEEELKLLNRNTEWLALDAVKHKHVTELPIQPYLDMSYRCVGLDTLLNEVATMLKVKQ